MNLYRNVGIPGQHDPGCRVRVDSTTNNGKLNCTILTDDGHEGMTTIGAADFAAAITAGWYVEEVT